MFLNLKKVLYSTLAIVVIACNNANALTVHVKTLTNPWTFEFKEEAVTGRMLKNAIEQKLLTKYGIERDYFNAHDIKIMQGKKVIQDDTEVSEVQPKENNAYRIILSPRILYKMRG